MTRSYYCNICQKVVTFKSTETLKKCSCSKVFEAQNKSVHEVNMRTTWSSQTKVEFNQMTMDEDIAQRNAR